MPLYVSLIDLTQEKKRIFKNLTKNNNKTLKFIDLTFIDVDVTLFVNMLIFFKFSFLNIMCIP